ncbi:hypothetical protein PIB30_078503 [Stylosanthes scabra]|uniref:Transposase MuDR plant domain-containing protein n=1 Tax=Stylosanthes scabra TaxID=79078 RepID=A0ABU6VR76_9FABA|nr:hypothetical protein [Stylosanthes scabra]
MDQPQPLLIRLHPNAVAHERQDGVWFQSDSPVVFQHADVSTMAELEAVFLYHLGGRFTEIRKVGYRYLQRQPDGKFLHLLVWSAASRLACRLRRPRSGLLNPPPETEAAMGHSESEEDDSDYVISTASSSDAQEGGAGGPETRTASCPHHVLPVPPPIPRVEDVPCYFQQLDLDEGVCSDPLNAGIGNDYNTNGGGVEIRVGHRMRNWEAVQTAIKNYSIQRNVEYRVIESDRIKYHCRCKHAADGCPWSIRVALRQNLGCCTVVADAGRFGSLGAPHVHCSDHVGRPLSVGQQPHVCLHSANGEDQSIRLRSRSSKCNSARLPL